MKGYSEVLPKVMEYAVDGASDESIQIEGRDIAILSEETFIQRLYINWPSQQFEQQLYQRLLTSSQVTCVAAYRGSGKTSAIRHAVKRLRNEYGETVRPVLLDIKDIYDIGTFAPLPDKPTEESKSRAYEVFKTEIRAAVQQELFHPRDVRRLLAWALAGPPDDSEKFNSSIVSDLLDVSNRAITAAKLADKTRRERMHALEQFLEYEPHFAEYEPLVTPRLRTAHVVRAAMSLHNWKRIVLIYDNIDRIAIPYQVKFMEAVNDTHNALKGTCGSIIAVRLETLRYPQPRANEKGDPIDIIAPLEAYFKDILYTDTKAEHIKAILQRRHELTIELCGQESVESQDDLRAVVSLHSCVIDEFVRDSIHALANGSVRAIAKLYTGFVQYVQEMERSGVSRGHDVRTDEGHLQTLFFLYLRDRARDLGLVYYEILKPETEWPENPDVSDIASPHHLVLTALLNLTRQLRETAGGDRVATFRELASRMKLLGFASDVVRDVVVELHAPPGEPPRLIEMLDDDVELAQLTAGSTARIRLTSAGYVLVTSLLHKVGYLWGQAHANAPRHHGRRERGKTYYELEPMERMTIFFEYVRHLAESHLSLLCALRRHLHPKYRWHWLSTYREHFAVGRELQVERLCKSAAAFYDPSLPADVRNPFRELLDVYRSYLRPINRGVEFNRLPLQNVRRQIDQFMQAAVDRAL